MPELFADDFNRGNTTGLGANWTDITAGWNVSSNTAIPRTGGSFNLTRNTSVDWSGRADQYARGTVVALGGSSVAVRIAAAANTCYSLFPQVDGAGALVKTLAGTDTTIDTGFPTNGGNGGDLAVGDTIEIQANGTTITGWCNGVEFLNATDPDIAAGNPGLMCFSTAGAVDNFSAGDFGSPPVPGAIIFNLQVG